MVRKMKKPQYNRLWVSFTPNKIQISAQRIIDSIEDPLENSEGNSEASIQKL